MKTPFPFVYFNILFIIFLFIPNEIDAKGKYPNVNKELKSQLLNDCATPQAQYEMNVNNVRARLLTGGDMWWDGANARYVVPADVPSGSEVSAIYAAGLWMGGKDPGGNLAVAAQTYGRSRGNFDYYAGPIDQNTFTTDAQSCQNWDRHFVVKAADIEIHLTKYDQSVMDGSIYDINDIPQSVAGWPARANPFFSDIYGFSLPNTTQGLAPFFDNNGDGSYNPVDGDYPILSIQGCDSRVYADEMVWTVSNDIGNIHTESGGLELGMETQTMNYAFNSSELEYHTFVSHRIINRSVTTLNDFYIGLWLDPDLGCYTDDYMGSSPERGMSYVYNEDAVDGSVGCSCEAGVNTYCEEIPVLGIDMLQGISNELGEQSIFSSFTLMDNPTYTTGPTTSPQLAIEYYDFLMGRWNDGTRMTKGGNGYDPLSTDYTNHLFYDDPNDVDGWSMCTASIPFGDRRILQTSGGITLPPGSVNQMVHGILWVPNVTHPCPDLSPLLEADDIVQELFDNCFEIMTNTYESEVPEQLLSEITLYPNPAFSNESTARTTLHIDGLPAQYTVELFTIDGKLLNTWQSQTGISNKNNLQFSQQLITEINVSAGMYFVKIHAPDLGTRTMKWVVQ